ncbi:phenylalanine--tRNA ligase subunit beta [Dactylosporangium aurantiacum]|uniref:Phenylalanine--tRNA ligase beta subunit n=1 Tax=Dactylosporangium aurantiacum TaxID=35754 RepID=A0A9Q9IF27_9ACTN|nr:phenylalanine--tRNA ligase subunit beta [Dactylosporangium aurantiacum]MDG6102922.1 phenylalanine--tRNA ligase subunit beta [Dactylosporangium aurantiacum]UWZ52852.1 phenylalanine--tRNA ligase subunit beta [Dactylosporangium aurantiacum]
MRVPLSWLREHVDLPQDLTADGLEKALVKVGLEVEEMTDAGASVKGPLVVGRVESIEELQGLKKPIRYCLVDVGGEQPQGIICGARNFAEGDLVVVALPGAVLPGGFAIAARKTYGHISNGMICSARELGVSDEHDGIIVLPAGTAEPGAEARPVVGLDDVVVEINVTPDRGYCFSVRGIARELSHSLGGAYRDPVAAVVPIDGDGTEAYRIDVRDSVACDRFTAVAVRGVDPAAPTPQWMKARLAVAGIRSISLPVDITNYLMIETGQPMHAWDLERLTGPLVVRRAAEGETLTTLDGVKRALHPQDIVIADDTGVVSLAAVMGGSTTEVSATTVDVLLEAAHWDPLSVARTIRRHKLPSEAGKRYERGVDPQITAAACARAAALLAEHGGGTVDPRVTDVYAVAPPAPVTMALSRPSELAGIDYTPERVVEILTMIGASVEVEDGGARAVVTPPSWRLDLVDPADLVEEVLRLDGYDRIPSVLPIAPPGSGLTVTQRRRRTVSRALADAGFTEALCYPFVGAATLDALRIPAGDPRRDLVLLRNPLSEEEPGMRTTLLPPLLGALRRNLGRGLRDLALYELGTVFLPDGPVRVAPAAGVDGPPPAEELRGAEALLPRQPWHVAAVIAGDADPAGWWGPGRPADWADAVDAARVAAEAAGVTLTVRAAAGPDAVAPWHPGRCAALLVGDTVVGHAGELHPAVCAALDLPRRTVAMELDLDALPIPGVATAPRLSGFPTALLDVALVVDAAVPAGDVESALTEGAGELLESVRLFDVYEGAQLGEGRKSLAYKLTFRAPDRTLTGEEALAARDAAVAVVADRFGAVLRGA